MSRSSLSQLSVLLWQERDILAKLLCHLDHPAEAERLSYSVRWLELERAMVAREAAREAGIDGDASLADLIEAAGPEWRSVLAEHRGALLALAEGLGRREPSLAAVRARHNGADPHPSVRPLPRRVQRSLRDFLA